MTSDIPNHSMEFVFVVPRRNLFPDAYPQGFVGFEHAAGKSAPSIAAAGALSQAEFQSRVEKHGFFVERSRAEQEVEWKQIIPYCLVTRTRDGELETFLLRRLAKGGEARLHDKLSIGVGGHLNPPDAVDRAAILTRGARRELAEELVLEARDLAGPIEALGLINDDANPVGAVHIGLVLRLGVQGPVSVRERSVLEGRFASNTELQTLAAQGAQFETWTQKLLAALDLFRSSPRNTALTAVGS